MKTVAMIEKDVVSKEVPSFNVGDTLKVHIRVQEGNKTRTQIFEGTCIRRRGQAAGASFTVIKDSHGEMVEKVFPLYSPSIEKIEVAKSQKVRRAKLYYLRKKK